MEYRVITKYRSDNMEFLVQNRILSIEPWFTSYICENIDEAKSLIKKDYIRRCKSGNVVYQIDDDELKELCGESL